MNVNGGGEARQDPQSTSQPFYLTDEEKKKTMELNKIYQGDALKILSDFPDDCIDCVVTSPPYWALRDYGVSGQLGLESTPEAYINALCAIFDQIKRVLKPTGTCFVNIGDTYYGGGRNKGNKNPKVKSKSVRGLVNLGDTVPGPKGVSKCLAQMPARFAIAMTDRGWILRNEIIWHKPNAMPASVTDRFTVDFEPIYFFTKNKHYYFDQEAVAEPITDSSAVRLLQDLDKQQGSYRANGGQKTNGTMKAVGRKPFEATMAGSGKSFNGHSGYRKADGTIMIRPKRNKRCVWSISTKGYKESHFAVYQQELIKIPIKAGSPEGGVVLDPFMGAGTTAVVARKLKRQYVGIEINPDYIKQAEQRLAQQIII